LQTAIRWRLESARQTLQGRRKAWAERPRGPAEAYAQWNRDCRWRRNCFRYDEHVGWRYLSNHYARVEHDGDYYVLKTNSDGLRCDHDYPKRAAAGRRRIALLGDSFTAGDGVSNGDRFGDLLEARFSDLDVINFGLPNTGTDQQLLMYRHVVKDYACDAIVCAVCVENVFRNLQTCRPSLEWSTGKVRHRAKPYFRLEEGTLALHHSPVPRAVRADEELGSWIAESSVPLTVEAFADAYVSTSDGWKLMAAILRELCREAEGTPVLVVPLPVRGFIARDSEPCYTQLFRELPRGSENVFVHDPIGAFHALDPRERLPCTFPRDTHYTQLGHELVADELAAALQRYMPDLANGPDLQSGRETGEHVVEN